MITTPPRFNIDNYPDNFFACPKPVGLGEIRDNWVFRKVFREGIANVTILNPLNAVSNGDLTTRITCESDEKLPDIYVQLSFEGSIFGNTSAQGNAVAFADIICNKSNNLYMLTTGKNDTYFLSGIFSCSYYYPQKRCHYRCPRPDDKYSADNCSNDLLVTGLPYSKNMIQGISRVVADTSYVYNLFNLGGRHITCECEDKSPASFVSLSLYHEEVGILEAATGFGSDVLSLNLRYTNASEGRIFMDLLSNNLDFRLHSCIVTIYCECSAPLIKNQNDTTPVLSVFATPPASATPTSSSAESCLAASKEIDKIAKLEKELAKHRSILAESECSICNVNGTKPCLNAGICKINLDIHDDNSTAYICDCPDDYSGTHCEEHIICGPGDCGQNATCTVFNHNKICSCPVGYTGDPKNVCTMQIATGCISGDPHYTTFDGSHYTYMGTCPYIVMQTYDHSFNIIGYNSFWQQDAIIHKKLAFNRRYPQIMLGLKGISVVTSFEFMTHNMKFKITADKKLFLNGIQRSFPYYYPSSTNPVITFTNSMDRVEIHDNSTGAVITFRTYELCITVPHNQLFYGTNRTSGVLGDIDGVCSNDYRLKNGTILNIPCDQGNTMEASIFADSWITDQSYNNCVPSTSIAKNPDCDPSEAQLQCASIRDAMSGTGPFAKCQSLTLPVIQQHLDDCIFDYCHGFSKCDIFDTFATMCLKRIPFVKLATWRDLTNCTMKCPKFSDYSLQTPICQNTCANPNYSKSPTCHDGYQEGCKCWPGYYLDSVGENGFSIACRRLNDCGCTDSDGNYYPANTYWLNDNCTISTKCENRTITNLAVECSIHGKCHLTSEGKMTCQCLAGYVGDGYSCIDVNECLNPKICKRNAGQVCINTPGSYSCTEMPKRHCADWYVYYGAKTNGIYNISIGPEKIPITVYCNMESRGGGWTLVSHGNSSSGKTYAQYVNGFGNPENEDVWLGLENLHLMTNQTKTSLRVVIERCRVNDVPDTTRECIYPSFSVLPSNVGYPVYIPEYCSNGNETIFDGFDGWIRWPQNETGPIFTAFDNDVTPYNCSLEYKNTGWWYYDKEAGLCGAANLNGLRQACNDNYLPQGYLTWHYDPVEDARIYLRPFGYPNYDKN